MPLFKNRSKTGNIKVYRPNGARYVHHEMDATPYSAFQKYASATAVVIELAVKDALYKFYQEFKEQPQDDYAIETLVTDRKISVTVIELNDGEG